MKSKYRDTIIFFKVGKFYELYEVSLQSVCCLVQDRMCTRAQYHCLHSLMAPERLLPVCIYLTRRAPLRTMPR